MVPFTLNSTSITKSKFPCCLVSAAYHCLFEWFAGVLSLSRWQVPQVVPVRLLLLAIHSPFTVWEIFALLQRLVYLETRFGAPQYPFRRSVQPASHASLYVANAHRLNWLLALNWSISDREGRLALTLSLLAQAIALGMVV